MLVTDMPKDQGIKDHSLPLYFISERAINTCARNIRFFSEKERNLCKCSKIAKISERKKSRDAN